MVMPILQENYRDAQAGRPMMRRIIGLELRLVYPTGGVEELALVPCDVRYPGGNTRLAHQLNVTVHTTSGDANFPTNALLPA